MNYVFGQASFDARVGIWSLARLKENATYDIFLRRLLKIAAHETGHMFSIKHCTKYECVMSGTNYLGETDSRPIDACPECMAKICWLSDVSPKDRYERLAAYCRKNGLRAEALDFDRKAKAVG
jgi:archaemetzincin